MVPVLIHDLCFVLLLMAAGGWSARREIPEHLQARSSWFGKVSSSEAYLDMLARKHEGALVLLGFYCVLLKMVESRWVVTFPFESLRILALQCSSQELCNVYVLTYLPLTDGISPTALHWT